MSELLLKEEVYQIISAAIEVHRELGCGFAEIVYQEALQIELAARQIPFEPQKTLRIEYKGNILNSLYVADLICFGSVVVELKALERVGGKEESQILNYLKATGIRVGLLINFGQPGKLDWHRYVL